MELGFEFASIVTVAICPLARLLYSLIDHRSKASKQVTKEGGEFAFPEDLLKLYLICLERIKDRPAGVCF